MKAFYKYILLLVLGMIYNHSSGQLNLNSTLSPGQYYNPVDVNAQPGATAIGTSLGVIHLFVNNSSVPQQTTYVNQLTTNILTNEANNGQQIPNTSLPVGKTPSTYGVSPSGGATYSVPIIVPPGTMGMVPKLSIVYSSQSAEGLLGYGWNLSGLSCIARVGQTPYHNFGATYPDQTQAVTLTNTDWFALDGNRLITTSGTNGANGTTYATESETFNLVTSKGTIGGGPDWFQVQTKNGLTMEYGHSLDSRLVPVGQNTVFIWYIDKITDQFGNYITFHYLNSNGEVNIQEIDYTGNSNAGFAPYNSIVFTYSKRTDVNTSYIAGGALNTSVVLNNITINSHSTFFKQYAFKYTSNLYTLLQEIDETGADHSTLNPLQFSYGADAPAVGSTCGNGPSLLSNNCVQADPSALGGNADGSSGNGQCAQYTLLDYNGDGKEDVISLAGTYSYDDNNNPFEPSPNSYTESWANQALHTGETPCPYFNSNSYTFPLGFPSSAGGTDYQLPQSGTASGSLSQSAMDFNGDGKDDYAVSTFIANNGRNNVAEGADEEEDINIALSTGTSFATANVLKAYDMDPFIDVSGGYGPAGDTLTFSGTFYLDLNGDGQMDVFNYHYDPKNNYEYYRVWLNAGSSSTTPQEQPSTTFTTIPTGTPSPNFEITLINDGCGYLDFSQAIPMDLNGDGKTELVNVTQHFGPTSKVIVSFDATQVYGQPNYTAEVDPCFTGSSVREIPGNGIVIQPDNSNFQYTNNTYVPNASTAYNNVGGAITTINNNGLPYELFGDFNGDGITDVLTYKGSTNSWTMNVGKGGGNYASLAESTLPTSTTDDPFSYPSVYYYAHDVNGDGKTDILEFIPNYQGSGNTVINTYYSTGNSFVEGEPITLAHHDINPQTWQIAFGDFNGDGVDDLLLENVIGDGDVDGPPILLYFYSGSHSRRLAEAVDGYNKSVQFSYQPLTNSAIYSQPQAANFRSATNTSNLLDNQPPVYVVSALTTVDGSGTETTSSTAKDGYSNYITYTDTSRTTYSYQDAIFSRQGLGFLGFLNTTSYNSLTGYSASSTYTVLPQFDNMVPSTSTVTAVSTATILSDGAYTYTTTALGGLRYFIAPLQTISNDDIAGVTNTTNYTYDSHGNNTDKNSHISLKNSSSVIETSDIKSTYVTSGTWIPSAVATTTTTVTYLSNPSYTRAASNNWDNAGHLLSAIMDPNTTQAVTTANVYDSHTGALLKQTTTTNDNNCISTPLISSYTYDTYSQFKTSSTNSLGQITQYTYNPLWGKIAKTITPDGLTTTYAYDAYGRSSQIVTPDGLTQTLTYHWVTSGELPIGGADPFSINSTTLYSVLSQKTGSPSVQTFYDWDDRKTMLETSTLSAPVFAEQAYDAMGHNYQSTNTYQKTAISSAYGDYDPVITTKLYNDVEYRLTSATATCNSATTLATTFSYTAATGNTTVKTTKPDGTSSSQTTDPAGMLVNATDYVINTNTVYSTVNYTYFSNGKASAISLNGNTVNTFLYDAFGRQTHLTDVNFGANNGGTAYIYQYNAYNQMVSQQDPNGDTYTMAYDILGRATSKVSSKEGTYTYSYVTSGNGLNMLSSQVLAPILNSNNTNGSNTSISYSYDNLHRPLQVNVNGLTTSYTYDAFNNVLTKTYPGSGFSISNKYNSNGYLTETDRASGTPIWQAVYMNPMGQYVDYTLGNGVHTIKSYTPYDLLTNISGGSYENIGYTFDPTNGNLLSRTEGSLTENFSYDASLNSRLTEAQSTYSSTATDIVESYDLNGNIMSKSDICAPTTTYTDGVANNQIAEVPNSNSIISPGQAITYTSFDAPSTVSLNSYSLVYAYGPDNNREISVLTYPTGNTATRYYGNAYEKTVYSNGKPDNELNYIQCGGDLVGMYVNDTMYYVYTDHLGSILTVTDGSTKTYNQSFDAWGSYRNPTDGSYNNIPANNPSWLYRGYTGHEHLAPFQLINANGRLYDPFVNSMLSPDITVQSPTNTQNYNRYSYCLNNPLKYSDPSGFSYIATRDMQANMAAAYANASAFAASINNELNAVDLYVGFDFQDQLSAGGGSGNDGGGGTGQGTAGNGGVSTGNTGTGADVVVLNGTEGPSPDAGSPSTSETYTVDPTPSGSTTTPANYVTVQPDNTTTDGTDWWSNYGNATLAATGGAATLVAAATMQTAVQTDAVTSGVITDAELAGIESFATYGGFAINAVSGYNDFISIGQNPSWGNWGRFGMDGIGMGLNAIPDAGPFLSIGWGAYNAGGGFQGFYDFLNMNQSLYNSTGTLMLPGPDGALIIYNTK